MAFERWACGAVRAGAVVAALLVGTGLVRCLGLGLSAWNPWLGGIGAGVFALHSVVNAFWSWPGWAECAAELDRRARTGDRFVTGWELGQRGSRTEMEEIAFQECAGFAGRERFEEFFPVRLPPGLLAGVAPLLSLALLVWGGNLEETRRAAVRRSGLQEVSAVVERLEALAREAEQRGNGDPVLAELAEKLRQGARDLKTDARDPESAQQAAMRELSRLEQMVQALQAGGMPQQAADMKALAEALSGSAEFQEMARALEEGRLSDAGGGGGRCWARARGGVPWGGGGGGPGIGKAHPAGAGEAGGGAGAFGGNETAFGGTGAFRREGGGGEAPADVASDGAGWTARAPWE